MEYEEFLKEKGYKSITEYIKKEVTLQKENYCERSKVPIGVYKDILLFYEKKTQICLFD